MYVVTFYSFKGGVGRSMALVSVAYELARTGRRVLLVDMDLEAPGLDTFNLPRPAAEVPGIVEFVTRYRETGAPPDVSEFLYASPLQSAGAGGLWIMPAGRANDEYEALLHNIDWERLYAQEDGYLLFEDLKAQWNATVQPDYVLIDSRTGHSDVSGICTRQLPDAVVLLFFPNEQNRRGLDKVVRDIRAEAKPPRNKNIRMHFVMSNVPDLDDEDRILATNLRLIRQSLGFDELTATINHYNSLSLLNQHVFTADHPRSRLTKQYQHLVRAIIRNNLADREGALERLSEIMPRPRRMLVSAVPIEELLTAIQKQHNADGEVLFRLSQIRRVQRRPDAALTLVNQAITLGFTQPEAYLVRAELRSATGEHDLAVADVRAVLESTTADYFALNVAVRLLLELDPAALSALPTTLSFQALDTAERLEIVEELLTSEKALHIAETILHDLYKSPGNLEHTVQNYLVLCLIGQGKYLEAKSFIPSQADIASNDSIDAFNYAMAEWGETGNLHPELLQPLIAMKGQEPQTPNHKQCAAIALWAAGERDAALRLLTAAEQQIMSEQISQFSAWRYLRVSPDDFLTDLEQTGAMIKGAPIVPAFIQRNTVSRSTT